MGKRMARTKVSGHQETRMAIDTARAKSNTTINIGGVFTNRYTDI